MRPFLIVSWCACIGAVTVEAQSPSAAAEASIPAAVRALGGCYRLNVGPWQGAPPDGPTMPSQQPPPQFRLDTVALARPFHKDGFAVEPARLSAYGHRPAGWTVVGDTVRLWWSTGFTGVQLRLAARGDTLVGHATTFHDAHALGEPPDPEAPVLAVRTRCAGSASRR